MQNRIIQYLMNMSWAKDKEAVGNVLQFVADCFSTVGCNSAGLVISGTTTKVKTGATDFYALVKGVMVKVAAATDMAVLVGSVTNAKFNVFVFFVDGAGTLTSAMGTEAATLAGVKFPDFPLDKALVGWVIINPTGTGAFVGGTTALGDATVVPNAAYVSPIGAVDPTVLYA